jgi:hypothetical protein
MKKERLNLNTSVIGGLFYEEFKKIYQFFVQANWIRKKSKARNHILIEQTLRA